MKAIEIEAYKARLVREILNIDDYSVLESVQAILSTSDALARSYNAPCQMSIEDVKSNLLQSEQRFDRNEYATEEDMEVFFDTLR